MDTGNQQQQQILNEITRHLCQAQAVQIRSLQNNLSEVIQQTTKALEENQPELAHTLWKQVVQSTQNISRLFNQTTNIVEQQSAPQQNGYNPYGRQGRRQFRGRQQGRGQVFTTPKQLDKIVRQVTEEVLAAA